MTEASKQRMEAVSKYFKEPSRNIYESGYKEGMQDPDAKKIFVGGIYWDAEKIEEMIRNHANQNVEAVKSLRESLILVQKLQEENKRLKESLWDLRNGMVNVHNLLLDYYSEEQVYWDNPNLAFKKSKESLEKLKESKALSSGVRND